MNLQLPRSTLLVAALSGALGGGVGVGLGLLVYLATFWTLLYAAILLGAVVAGGMATVLTSSIRSALRRPLPWWPWRSCAVWTLASILLAYAVLLASPAVHDNLVLDAVCVVGGCAVVGVVEALVLWARAVTECQSVRDFLARYDI